MDKRPLEAPVEEPAKKTKKELLAIEREKARTEREAEKSARKEAFELQKQQREAARALEKEQREKAKIEKQKERDAAKEAKEKERLAQREAKEREKEVQRLAKEREKEAQKEAKEREKEAQMEAKERERMAQQPRLGAFFSIVKKPDAEKETKAPSTEYENTFLQYHYKANCEVFNLQARRESPDDTLEWLKSQSKYTQEPCITAQDFKTQLNLGYEPQKLLNQVKLRHIQLFETVRPAFVGTVPDISPELLDRMRLEPTAHVLDLEYEYDSDLEWAPGDEDDEDLMDDDQSEDDGENNSDMESFLASDDEAANPRKKAIMAVDPMVKWNDGTDTEFLQFSIKVFAKTPIAVGAHKVVAAAPAPPKAVELPREAISAILKGIQGHTGTKALLLESLYHDLHKEFSLLTRSGLKNVVDTHAKREKTGWIVLPDKIHLLGA